MQAAPQTAQIDASGKAELDQDRVAKRQPFILKFKKWKSINIVEYRLVMLIIVVGILFAGSLLFINRKRDAEQTNQQFQATVDEINNKLSSMEAALIYQDDNRAQELLTEARGLLASLPQTTSEQLYTFQTLSKSIGEQVNKIYKLEKITSPSVLAVLPVGFTPTANLEIGSNNIIYLYCQLAVFFFLIYLPIELAVDPDQG